MRNEAIKRAARLRSAITTCLSVAGEPLTINGLKGCVSVAEITTDAAELDRVLRNMRNNGEVSRINVQRPDDRSCRFAFEVSKGNLAPVKLAIAKRTIADVQVDLVKSTGRLRIVFHGLTIEIGVV